MFSDSEVDLTSGTESPSQTEKTNDKEQTNKNNSKDIGNFVKALQKAGHGRNNDESLRHKKQMIETFLLPRVKFVDDSILTHNGLIAQVMKKKLPEYGDIRMEMDLWKFHWTGLSKLIRLQTSIYKLCKSQQIGKTLLGKLL